MKPCNDISWNSGALKISKTVRSVILWGSHWMHTTYCEEEGEKSGNIPNCRRNLFFPSWESRAHWKVFERFYDFCTLHIAHGVQANQAHRPSHHMRTTNKQQILAEFLRCAHVYKHQDQLRQNVLCVTTSPPPHFTCHTTAPSTNDIKRVNKNIRRLLAVTGPCSWMTHNFSQFPR